MTAINERHGANDGGTVLHWYDFICPFCYVGQQRNAMLARHGLEVVELAFQAHPEIPDGGIAAGPRDGTMYAGLEREAREAGLVLNWPRHLPNSRRALATAEWSRQHQSSSFAQLQEELFAAHFALGEDLEDQGVIDRHASASGIDLAKIQPAFAYGSAVAALAAAEAIARQYGVQGTPAWLFPQGMIMGLRPASDFERLANEAKRLVQ
jgi:predicted DsbA family dithiol-disulfide isomerase